MAMRIMPFQGPNRRVELPQMVPYFRYIARELVENGRISEVQLTVSDVKLPPKQALSDRSMATPLNSVMALKNRFFSSSNKKDKKEEKEENAPGNAQMPNGSLFYLTEETDVIMWNEKKYYIIDVNHYCSTLNALIITSVIQQFMDYEQRMDGKNPNPIQPRVGTDQPGANVANVKLPVLSEDMWLEIFQFMEPLDWGRCARVSKQWQTVAYKDLLWLKIWKLHFEDSPSGVEEGALRQTYLSKAKKNFEQRVLTEVVAFNARISVRAASCGKMCQRIGKLEKRETVIGFLQADGHFHSGLLDAARSCYEFMRKVNAIDVLGDSQFLNRVLPRYKKFLQLAAKNPDTQLVATFEIEVCWQAHLIRTLEYRNFCVKKFGSVVDHKNILSDRERVEGLEVTAYLWEKEYNGKYCMDWEEIKQLTEVEEWEKHSVTAIDIIKDRDWLGLLDGLYKDDNVEFSSDTFLKRACEQYEKFLLLIEKYPQDYDSPGPTHPVDLFWHTHQMHPLAYESDCIAIMGKLLDHDPWPHERFSTANFRGMIDEFSSLWKHEFKEVEWISTA